MSLPAIPKWTIFFYFFLTFLGTELSKQTGFFSIRILSFVPATFYIVVHSRAFLKKNVLVPKNVGLFVLIVSYLLLHVRAASLIGETMTYVVYSFLALFIHATFWYLVSINIRSQPDLDRVLRYLFGGLMFCFVVVVLIPMNYIGTFEIGGHYNLGDINTPVYVPFINSTLEPPLLTSIACMIAIVVLGYKFRLKRFRVKSNVNMANLAWCLVILALGLMELVLINRRGPMVITFLLFAMTYFSGLSYRTKLIYLIPLLSLVPVFWGLIVELILPLIQSDLAGSLVARTDEDNVRSATGRILQWGIAIRYIMHPSVSVEYLLGVGNLDEYLTLGAYGHAHNSFFQLFIQVGLVGTVLNSILIVVCLHHCKMANRKSFLSFRVLILTGLFMLILLLSTTESLFMGSYFSHLFFITLAILLIRSGKLSNELKGN